MHHDLALARFLFPVQCFSYSEAIVDVHRASQLEQVGPGTCGRRCRGVQALDRIDVRGLYAHRQTCMDACGRGGTHEVVEREAGPADELPVWYGPEPKRTVQVTGADHAA